MKVSPLLPKAQFLKAWIVRFDGPQLMGDPVFLQPLLCLPAGAALGIAYYDNCIMETFFGRLKNEIFYGFEEDYPSFDAFQSAIAEYIDYYNNRRIQAKTKWMPPSKFREASMMKC